MTVSGVESVRMRVQLYERCFRRKPDKRVPVDGVRAGLSRDTYGALGGVKVGIGTARGEIADPWAAADTSPSSAASTAGQEVISQERL
jgi:hypothetical protein